MNPNITSAGVLTDSTGTRQLVDKETFNFDRITNTASDFETNGTGQWKVRAVAYGFVLENNTAFSGGGGRIPDTQAMIVTVSGEPGTAYDALEPGRLLEIHVQSGELDLSSTPTSVAATGTVEEHVAISINAPTEDYQRVNVHRQGYLPVLVGCDLKDDVGSPAGVMIYKNHTVAEFVSLNGQWELQNDTPAEAVGNTLVWPFSSTTTLTQRIDTTDGMPYRIEYSDGSEEWFASGVVSTHTFGASTEGTATIYLSPGSKITRISNLNNLWAFSAESLSDVTNLTRMQSGAVPMVGDIGSLASMTGIDFLQLSGDSLYGSVSVFKTFKDLTYVQIANSSVSGKISAFAESKGLTQLRLGASSVGGDVATIAGLTNLTRLELGGTNVLGTLASLQPLTNLTQLAINNTALEGDFSDLTPLTGLTHISAQFATSLTLSDATAVFNALPNLVEFTYSASLTTTAVDTLIAQIAASTISGAAIDISYTNKPRSAASDADVAIIEGRGNTIATS